MQFTCHVANGYRVWLGNRALGKALPKVKLASVDNVHKLREVFKRVDALVYEFLDEFRAKWDPSVSWQSDSAELTELWLFTHTITHEFHHRGQTVKLGRIHGFIPPKLNLTKLQVVDNAYEGG